jgi:peptide deformylase
MLQILCRVTLNSRSARTRQSPELRETAERVDKHEFGPELKTFCNRMIAFMKESKGMRTDPVALATSALTLAS